MPVGAALFLHILHSNRAAHLEQVCWARRAPASLRAHTDAVPACTWADQSIRLVVRLHYCRQSVLLTW